MPAVDVDINVCAESGGVGRLIKTFNKVEESGPSVGGNPLSAAVSNGVQYKSIEKITELPLSASRPGVQRRSQEAKPPAVSETFVGERVRDRIDFTESEDEASELRRASNVASAKTTPNHTAYDKNHDSNNNDDEDEGGGEELEAYATLPPPRPHYYPTPVTDRMEMNGPPGLRKMKLPNTAIYKVEMFRFIETATKRILFHLAKSSARYRLLFVLIPILLVLPCFLGPWLRRDTLLDFSRTPFHYFLSLPDPTTTVAGGGNTHLMAPYFNSNNPHFDALRRTSQAEFGILLSAKNKFGNVLSNRSLTAYSRLSEDIRRMSIPNRDAILSWTDMCRDCLLQPVKAIKLLQSLNNSHLVLKYPGTVIYRNGSSLKEQELSRIFIGNLLGDLELENDGIITRARTIQLNLKLKESLTHSTYSSFERQLRELIGASSHALSGNRTLGHGQEKSNLPSSSTPPLSDEFLVNYWSVRSYVSEVGQCLRDVHVKLIASATVAVALCSAISFSRDSYQSRPFVGLNTGMVFVLSTATAYAVHFFGTGQMNSMLFPAPFVLLGVIVLYFSSTQLCHQRYTMASLHPMEKLAFIYSWDMPSIVLSLVALAVASVATGVYTDIDHLRHLMFLSAVGLISACLFISLYMTVCWMNSGRRQASGLRWYQLCEKGDEAFNDKYVLDYDELTSIKLHEKLTDTHATFTRLLGRLAANYNLRTVSVALFTLALILAVMSSGLGSGTGPVIEMREEFFVPQSSSSSAYLRKFRSDFAGYDDYLELIVDHTASPSYAGHFDYLQSRLLKEQLGSMLKWATEQQYLSRVVNWLVDFDRFQRSTVYDINPDTIVPVLSFVFLRSEPYEKYSTDIIFDKFQTQVLRSRLYLELSERGKQESNALIKGLLKRAKAASVPLSVKAPFSFSLHHDLQIVGSMLSSFLFLVATLTALCFLFFPQPAICLCVPFSCIATSIGCLGVASYLTIPLNIVTLSAILLGNLLTSVVSIHFCYMFSSFTPDSQREALSPTRKTVNVHRVQYAFQSSLMPAIFGLAAPLIAYLPLLLNDAPILFHVWKVLVIHSLLTTLHLLFVLPSFVIILSDYLTYFFLTANRLCGDENGAGCCNVVQPAESIYFVGAERTIRSARELGLMLPYPIGVGSRFPAMAIMPPAYCDPRYRLLMAPPSLPPLPAPPLSTRGELETRSPGRNATRQRVIIGGGERASRSQVRETTEEESNFDTLDSSNGKSDARSRRNLVATGGQIQFPPSSSASSRRQTPKRERRQAFVGNVTNVNIAESEEKNESKRRSKSDHHSVGHSSGRRSERIYEEPVDAPPIRYRRSGSAGGVNGSKVTARSPRSPAARRAEAVKQATGLIYDPKVHRRGGRAAEQPNWRQFLVEDTPPGSASSAALHRSTLSSSPIPSPRLHRKRF